MVKSGDVYIGGFEGYLTTYVGNTTRGGNNSALCGIVFYNGSTFSIYAGSEFCNTNFNLDLSVNYCSVCP